MKLKTGLFLTALSVAIIFGCGKDKAANKAPEGSPTGNPVTSTKKVTLAVFGAHWCGPCKTMLPEINDAILADPALKGAVIRKVYVESGCTAGKGCKASIPPTQVDSDRYAAEHKLDFKAVPDLPFRCSFHAKIFKTDKCPIPAAVILTEDGQTVIKDFAAGTFIASDVVSSLKDQVNAK